MSSTAILTACTLMALQLGFAQVFDDACGAMRTLMWHKDQKAVSALDLANWPRHAGSGYVLSRPVAGPPPPPPLLGARPGGFK